MWKMDEFLKSGKFEKIRVGFRPRRFTSSLSDLRVLCLVRRLENTINLPLPFD